MSFLNVMLAVLLQFKLNTPVIIQAYSRLSFQFSADNLLEK